MNRMFVLRPLQVLLTYLGCSRSKVGGWEEAPEQQFPFAQPVQMQPHVPSKFLHLRVAKGQPPFPPGPLPTVPMTRAQLPWAYTAKGPDTQRSAVVLDVARPNGGSSLV